MCIRSDVAVADNEYNAVIESFAAVSTNEECFCGYFSADEYFCDDDLW